MEFNGLSDRMYLMISGALASQLHQLAGAQTLHHPSGNHAGFSSVTHWIGLLGKILTGNPWVFLPLNINWGFRFKFSLKPIQLPEGDLNMGGMDHINHNHNLGLLEIYWIYTLDLLIYPSMWVKPADLKKTSGTEKHIKKWGNSSRDGNNMRYPLYPLVLSVQRKCLSFFLRSKCSQERDQHEQSSAQNAHGSL